MSPLIQAGSHAHSPFRGHAQVRVSEPPHVPGRRAGSPGGRGQTDGDGEKPVQHHRNADPLQGRHHLQQLLRIRHRQVSSRRSWRTRSSPRPGRCPSKGWSARPRVIDIDEILKLAPLEERIYRMRCVEGWSMVIPWVGFSLSELIKHVEPLSKARYVAFQSFYDSKQMPAAGWAGIAFPYVEGLRMDEAMNPLTLLCVGLYGDVLPKQNGAPVRIVVPWKYGFKSIKSIVRIRFVEKQPPTTWSRSNPHRVRLLLQRQPEGRSSALEPGQGAAPRRILQARHADVQRLRRPGRARCTTAWTCARTTDAKSRWSSSCAWRRWRCWSGEARTGPGRQPDRVHHPRNRRLDAALLASHAGHHARAPSVEDPRPDPLPPHVGPVRVLLRRAALHDLRMAGQVLRRCARC